MDDLIKIEFRGIAGLLPLGSVVTVEHCEAGVLMVRLLKSGDPAPKNLQPMPKPGTPVGPAMASPPIGSAVKDK